MHHCRAFRIRFVKKQALPQRVYSLLVQGNDPARDIAMTPAAGGREERRFVRRLIDRLSLIRALSAAAGR